ncbi:MAG: M1 family metallopeptidase [Fidelibacterota bacterium]|nr:MAG: M1 family metallopeptidase [Candidatus Neomarinimicrobiota bacterium]
MQNIPLLRRLLLAGLCFAGVINAQTLTRPDDYFQQDVAYRIDVTLDDRDHTLSAFLSLDYTNNSPDTLHFIWFHLWPNGYRNNQTAFAQQRFRQGSRQFYYTRDEERGYIDSLDFRSGETTLKWEYHPEWIDVARVHLPHPLPPGGVVTIETPFFVKIPRIFSRMGHTGNHYEITQWYPKPAVYDRHGWHAMPYLDLGEFYSEFGSFDVRITLPEEYVVMATGDLPEGDPEYVFLDSLVAVTAEYYALKTDNDLPDRKARRNWLKQLKKREFAEPGEGPTKTLHFHQERVHDFAWFADKRYLVQKGILWVEDSSRAITLWSLYLPELADLWEESIEYIHDAAQWMGRQYGTYPYNHVSAASSREITNQAMEYPNITIIGIAGNKELLEITIMHEVGHNWHYGIFGFNEREHTWLDEGLTGYSEIPYWHTMYGPENGARFFYGLPDGLNRLLRKPFTRRSVNYFFANLVIGTRDNVPINSDFTTGSLFSYAFTVHQKAPVVFDFVGHYLGEERNRTLWDAFAETWSFAHPGPGDLRMAYETVTGEDLSWFFDDLIGTTKQLDYGVSGMTRLGSEVKLTVTNYGEIEAPVEVATLDEQGAVLALKWIPGFTGSRTITFSGGGVYSATTDPGRYAPDADRSNDHLPLLRLGDINLQKPALRFLLSAPEMGRSQLFFLPMLYGTAYSGLLPGAAFYGGALPPSKNAFTGGLYYSLKRKRLAGSAGLALTRYRLWGTDQLSVKMKYSGYPDYSLMRFGAEAIFRERAVSSPALSVSIVLDEQNLTEDALDETLWDTGTFTSAALNAKYWNHAHALLDWDLDAHLRTVTGQADGSDPVREAVILQSSARVSYRHAWKGLIRLRAWLGHTLTDKHLVPDQYRFWLSGGLNTDFNNLVALNRTGTGALAVYRQFYIPDEGPGIRALTTESPGMTAWSMNLDVTSGFPIALFADVAGTNNGGNASWQTYMDAGIILRLGLIKFIIPLWHSWAAEDGQQPYKSWRVSISLPRLNL